MSGLGGVGEAAADRLGVGLPRGAGAEPCVGPVGVSRESARDPPEPADVQPTAARPVTLSTVSAARPPQRDPFLRRTTACPGPLPRRRPRAGVALCAVMVVQVVIGM